MPDKKTFSQVVYPDASLPHISDINHWSRKQSRQFMELMWKGIDLFVEDFPNADFKEVDEQIERDLTQFIERRVMTGDEPFYVQYEAHEMESRASARAMPPQYDIAFVLRENERLMFPFEAKVLKTDEQLTEYVDEIKNNFLSCRYAPFSYEGAMIGYLISGTALNVFRNLEDPPGMVLKENPDFINRPQRYSDHSRIVPIGKELVYPSEFRCHHLILELSRFQGKNAELET